MYLTNSTFIIILINYTLIENKKQSCNLIGDFKMGFYILYQIGYSKIYSLYKIINKRLSISDNL